MMTGTGTPLSKVGVYSHALNAADGGEVEPGLLEDLFGSDDRYGVGVDVNDRGRFGRRGRPRRRWWRRRRRGHEGHHRRRCRQHVGRHQGHDHYSADRHHVGHNGQRHGVPLSRPDSDGRFCDLAKHLTGCHRYPPYPCIRLGMLPPNGLLCLVLVECGRGMQGPSGSPILCIQLQPRPTGCSVRKSAGSRSRSCSLRRTPRSRCHRFQSLDWITSGTDSRLGLSRRHITSHHQDH